MRPLASIALERVFSHGFDIRAQLPLRLGAQSLPEPDVAVVRGAPRDYLKAHPRTAELVVEVADSSLDIDRGRKLRLYAREGISEYWIINLVDDCVETHRQPNNENYRERRIVRRGEAIAAGPVGMTIAVSDLLP